MAIPTGEFIDDNIPTGEFVTGEFVDEEPKDTFKVTKVEGNIPKEYEKMRDLGIAESLSVSKAAVQPKAKLPQATVEVKKKPTFGDKMAGALKKHNEERLFTTREADEFFDAVPATIGALADIAASIPGIPASLAVFAETLRQNPGDFDKAYTAFETTREWSSVRHIVKEYGIKMGLEEKEIEQYLYHPNFIDKLMQALDEKALEPAARLAGYEEHETGLRGFGKTLLKDSLTLGVPAAVARGIKPRTLSKDYGKEITEGLKEKAEREAPIIPKEQLELFPAKDEQLAFQFGEEVPKGEFIDDSITPFTLDRAFEEAQGQLPLEHAKGQTPDMFAPLKPEVDVAASEAKNPYLDPTSVREFEDPGFIEGRYPKPDKIELPKTGVLEDSTGTLKDANLPFKLSGDKNAIKYMRTFGSLAPAEMEALKKFFMATGKPALEFDPKGQLKDTLGALIPRQGGWVKLPGGNWNRSASSHFHSWLISSFRSAETKYQIKTEDMPYSVWADKTITKYFNKYLGTERDPIKDIEIPVLDAWAIRALNKETVTIEEVTDFFVKSRTAEEFRKDKYTFSWEIDKKAKPNEIIWEMEHYADFRRKNPNDEKLTTKALALHNALQQYITHASDYLKNHVPKDKLHQYDFTRLIKEVKEQDIKQAKAMEKAQFEKSKIGTALHKQYPDGMEWREVGKSEITDDILNKYEIEIRNNEATAFPIAKDISTSFNVGIPLGKTDVLRRSGLSDKDISLTLRNDLKKILEKENAEEALRLEGNMMGHCVGGYCESVRNGHSKIFSLRDKQGKPHVTIEVSPHSDFDIPAFKNLSIEHEIFQIKGKQDRKPVEKYIPYVQDFIREGGYVVRRDLQNADLYEIGTKNGSSYPPEILDRYNKGFVPTPNPKELLEILGKPGYYTKEELLAAVKQFDSQFEWNDAAGKFVRKTDPENIKYMRSFGGLAPGDKWIPRIWASSSEAVKNKFAQISSPYVSLREMIADYASGLSEFPKEKDIAWLDVPQAGAISKNQVPMSFGHKPSLTYAVNSVRAAYASRQRLSHEVATMREEFNTLVDSNEKALKVLAVATELNKFKYQKTIQQGAEATDMQLQGLGLNDREIAAYRILRQINDKLYDILDAGRKDLTGKSEKRVSAYHPKSHGIGDHALIVASRQGNRTLLARRFQNYNDMVQARKQVVEELTKANELHNYVVDHRSDMKSFDNPFANIDDSNVPDVVQKILASVEEKIETRQRTFEMERTAGDVKGLVQYLEGNKPDPMLLDVWNNYTKMVLDFHKNVQLFKVQREFIDPKNRWYFDDKPNIFNWVKDLIQDELGADTSWKYIKSAEKVILSAFNEIAKAKIRVTPGQKLITGEDFVISNNLVRSNTKFAAGAASGVTLLFDSPNALVNALQMPLTGTVGLPLDVLGRLKADPARVVKWSAETNIKFMRALNELAYTKLTGKPTPSSIVLDKYSKDGFVRAHMFDEITEVAESNRAGFQRTVGKTLNTGKAWTNDLFIEQPTNATALLYYDILINEVAKDYLTSTGITPKQLKEAPVILAKSWTGEYQRWTRPQYLRKLGFVGDTVGNFATWGSNQWGRFYEAIGDAARGLDPKSGVGLMQGAGYAVAMWYIYSHLAGGKGAPVAASMDGIINWANQFKENDEDPIPDLNYLSREYGIPEWAFPMTSAFDDLQKGMGIENPVELGGGQRYSNPVQMNLLTFQFWASVGRTLRLAERELFPDSPWNTDEKEPVTRKDWAKATERLPRWAKGIVMEDKLSFPRPDGTKAIVNKYDSLAFTQKDEHEAWLNKLGFKTTRQVKEQEMIRHDRITEALEMNEPKRVKDRLITSYIDYLNSPEEFDADKEAQLDRLAMRYSNLNKDYNRKQFDKDVEERLKRMLLRPEEKLKIESRSTKSTMKKERMQKRWDRLGLYE